MVRFMAEFVTTKTGVFFFIFLISVLPVTEAQCIETGEPTFGQDCSFFCHCMDNEQCDFTTGNCSKGCDFDWVGPACQRRNIILLNGENEDYAVIRHSSNTSPNKRYALLAVDKNLTSCSYTNYANLSTDYPWWRVWLHVRHTIRNIVIVTETSAIDYFKGFTVRIGNVTYADRLTGKFDDNRICYTHTGSAPETKTIHVTCNNDVIGNQVNIELANKNAQLVLCDVRIYGECQNGTFGETCTERCSQYCEDTCDKINGTCESCRPGWAGSHCDHECATGFYGYGCRHNCSDHCVKDGRICDSINGSCLSGCQEGWFGNNCSQGCPWGMYGHNCLQKCSNNCVGGSLNCDRVYGSCLSGCKVGLSGRKCDKECTNGTWGLGCVYSCGNCESRTCRPTDGICYDGCLPGVKHSAHCDEVCAEGTYGLNCSSTCSENCRGTCDRVTGKCRSCKNGWNGEMCRTACDEGSWGDNCERRCLGCHDEKCDRFSGRCHGLCKPGFKQTDYCDQECDSGWFGINCTEKCSQHCRNVSECRKSDGQCFGCKLGWEGEHCEKVFEETNEMIPDYIFRIGIAVSSIVILTVIGLVLRFVIRKRKLNRDKVATVSCTNNLSAAINTNMCSGTEACQTDRTDNVYLTAIGNSDARTNICGAEAEEIAHMDSVYQKIKRKSDSTTNICCAEADEIDHMDSVYQTIIRKSDITTLMCGTEADDIDHMDSEYLTVKEKTDSTTNICCAEADEIDHMDSVYQTIIRKSDITTLMCGTEADDIDHMDSEYLTVKEKTGTTTNICGAESDEVDHKDSVYQTIIGKTDVDSAGKPVYQKLNDVLDGT